MRLAIPSLIVLALIAWFIWNTGGSRQSFSHFTSTETSAAVPVTKRTGRANKQGERSLASQPFAQRESSTEQIASSEWQKIVQDRMSQFGKEMDLIYELPPCEKQRLLREASLRFDPPKSCPEARKIYENLFQVANILDRQCNEISERMQTMIEVGLSCVGDEDSKDYAMATEMMDGLEKRFQDDLSPYVTKLVGDESLANENFAFRPEGEFRNPGCALVPIITRVFVRTSSNFQGMHFGVARNEIQEICASAREGLKYDGFYNDYLRYGENGNPAMKQRYFEEQQMGVGQSSE